ncbi:MAG TPA: acyl-CoA dehydrogenase family protein [Vicinamibacterales bacterium]
MTATSTTRRGGSWLIEDAAAGTVLTRERLNDEQRLIGQTADAFVDNEVLPKIDRLESKDWTLARELVRGAADLGLLATDVPDAYGGLELDKASSVVVGEAVGRCASFATTFGAQTGLTITPILCFGTEDQKRRYLPKLVTGEIIGAYALSESGSGSDALGARARATKQPDGSYLLSGEKMWITNGGFADLFIVFAKVDGEHFTGFIVERAFPGVTGGREEHKLGLLGSSTTSLLLEDARVPAENLLGEVGKGHKIAFNTLNYGRLKLGAMCSGGARLAIEEAARYAATRKQFGKPIASFGAIRQKLGDMTARQYAVEAMLYRTAGMIDAALAADHSPPQVLAVLEEFAVEASILKVAASEAIDFILDENVQVHGGNGFVRDYPAERHYRDARVNRIFEGTNEINRLLIPGMLARRAAKGELPLIPAAKRLMDEVMAPPALDTPSGDPLDAERRSVTGMKKVALMVLGTAMDTYREKLADEQEVLLAAADILIDTYASESAVLRAVQGDGPLHEAAARIYVADAASRVEAAAKTALAAMADGDALRIRLAALRRLLKPAPINTIVLRRLLADATVERRSYLF